MTDMNVTQQLGELHKVFSIKQMAELIGTHSIEQTRKWVRGDTRPRLDRIEKIEELYKFWCLKEGA